MSTSKDKYDIGYAPARVKKAKQFWQLVPSSGTLTIRGGKIKLTSTPKNKQPQIIFDLSATEIKKATFAPIKSAVLLSIKTINDGDYTIQFSSGVTVYSREAKEVRNTLKNLGVPTTYLVPGPLLSIVLVAICLVALFFYEFK